MQESEFILSCTFSNKRSPVLLEVQRMSEVSSGGGGGEDGRVLTGGCERMTVEYDAR
jgi:hypothetical protein